MSKKTMSQLELWKRCRMPWKGCEVADGDDDAFIGYTER